MIGLLMMLAAGPVTFVNGNELHEQCISADAQQQALCFGHFIGIADGIAIAETASTPEKHSSCIPSNASRRQIVDVAKNYLRDNPADRNRPASVLIYVALRAAFPCSAG